MDTLAKLRRKKGLTQEEVSKRLGIPRSTLGNYEKGRREPNLDTVRKFASFYEVSFDELFGYTPKIVHARNPTLKGYEKLSDDGRKIVNDMIRALLSAEN